MSPITLLITTSPISDDQLSSLPQDHLVMELCPALGGAWTEWRCHREVIRFGFPENSPNPWFHPLAPPKSGHNILSQALERMVFARGINKIKIEQKALTPIATYLTLLHPDAVTLCTSESNRGNNNTC